MGQSQSQSDASAINDTSKDNSDAPPSSSMESLLAGIFSLFFFRFLFKIAFCFLVTDSLLELQMLIILLLT